MQYYLNVSTLVQFLECISDELIFAINGYWFRF